MLLGSYYDTVTLFCVCCLVIMLTLEGGGEGQWTKDEELWTADDQCESSHPPTVPGDAIGDGQIKRKELEK